MDKILKTIFQVWQMEDDQTIYMRWLGLIR